MAPNGEQLLPEETLPVEGELPLEGVPPVGVPPEAIETLEPASKMTHTVEEAPELMGKEVGELVPMRVVGVSDDGKTIDLEFVPLEELQGQAPPPQPLAPTGEEGVVQTMLG